MKFTNALGGCANCGALTSPCWRKGPEEAKHLCNACGSRYLVKGTLEGYKPGLKNRTGGKRSKQGKGKGFPASYAEAALDRSDHMHKRNRVLKPAVEHQSHIFIDKAVQVNVGELQRMEPYVRSLPFDVSDEGYLDDQSPRSPKSHFDRLKQEVYQRDEPAMGADLKDSSDESSPDAEMITASGSMVSRRRARKPFRPQVSTW